MAITRSQQHRGRNRSDNMELARQARLHSPRNDVRANPTRWFCFSSRALPFASDTEEPLRTERTNSRSLELQSRRHLPLPFRRVERKVDISIQQHSACIQHDAHHRRQHRPHRQCAAKQRKHGAPATSLTSFIHSDDGMTARTSPNHPIIRMCCGSQKMLVHESCGDSLWLAMSLTQRKRRAPVESARM